jgi:hypothetical protein
VKQRAELLTPIYRCVKVAESAIWVFPSQISPQTLYESLQLAQPRRCVRDVFQMTDAWIS